MRALLRDFRYGLRMLRRNPGLTVIATLSLALGIGVNASIFSFADADLFRPLHIPEPGRLLHVYATTKAERFADFSYPDYCDLRDQNKSFSGLLAFSFIPVSFSRGGEAGHLPQVVYGFIVSGNVFEVLQSQPALGRSFLPEEDRVPGAHPVAMLSYGFWQRSFDSDPQIIGKTIRVNGRDFEVIGVAPERFEGFDPWFHPSIYVPLAMQAQVMPAHADLLHDRSHRWLSLRGRLAPGVELEQARSEMASLAAGLARDYPETGEGRTVNVLNHIQARLQGNSGEARFDLFLMTIVGLVLLIACANVASLLLGRNVARSREIAVRIALGAERRRLIRQLVSESMLLAMPGAALGLLFASWGMPLFRSIGSAGDIPLWIDVRLDVRVVLFTIALALLSTLASCLVPALQATRPVLTPFLSGNVISPAGHIRLPIFRDGLVAGQIAVSMLLLIIASLFVKAFRTATNLDPGFRRDHVLLMSFEPRLQGYSDSQARSFFDSLRRSVGGLPGVEATAWATTVPLDTRNDSRDFWVEGYQFPSGHESAVVDVNAVSPGYFQAMRIPLLLGRDFADSDRFTAQRVAIVNETFVRRFWPGRDPLGGHIRMGRRGAAVTIIGVARDIKYLSLIEFPRPFVYLPADQEPAGRMTLHVFTAGDPATLAGAVRGQVGALDAHAASLDMRTLDAFYRDRALAGPRIATILATVSGGVALFLTVIGLYGVISWSVARRTRDIGIRTALGARRIVVLWMVIRQGMILAGIGAAFGLLAAFAVTRLLGPFLLGVSPRDAVAFGGAPVLLGLVALVASYIPARRAASLDPLEALRHE